MQKDQIHNLINEKHDALFNFLAQHDDSKWDKGPEGKWTTGQHIVHLNQAGKPLNKALGMPKFLLQYKFGKANRATRSYEEVTHNYNIKLSKVEGPVISPYSVNMPETPPSTKPEIVKELEKHRKTLLKRLSKLSDKQLDKYLLPHPLMGRMILREIIMWSAYHVEHHHKILVEKY